MHLSTDHQLDLKPPQIRLIGIIQSSTSSCRPDHWAATQMQQDGWEVGEPQDRPTPRPPKVSPISRSANGHSSCATVKAHLAHTYKSSACAARARRRPTRRSTTLVVQRQTPDCFGSRTSLTDGTDKDVGTGALAGPFVVSDANRCRTQFALLRRQHKERGLEQSSCFYALASKLELTVCFPQGCYAA